jgi:putative ABC transport system permease protein
MNIKNDILVSLRHIRSDKVNSAINITGIALALGIVAVVLVFVLNELGYNNAYKNKDRIYRVLNHNVVDNSTWANTPYVLGETLKENVAEVENVTHQYNIADYSIEKGNEFIRESAMLCTNASFFDMFGVRLIQGTLENFDRDASLILLSKKMAVKYFNDDNAVGKVLKLRTGSGEFNMTVAAVYEDLKQNSSIRASVITDSDFGMKHLASTVISNSQIRLNEVNFREEWNYGQFVTNYILLKKGASAKDFETKLRKIGEEHSGDYNKMSFSLQPLSDIYFGSEKLTDNNSGDLGNKAMLLILASVGLLILIIACINYLNLTSAQALTHTRTFAVRTVCGAPRSSLTGQMMLESVFISLIALPFALLLAQFSLPVISHMLGKEYLLALGNQFFICMAILILITIITGAFSGFLVSRKITSLNLADTLKGQKIAIGHRHNMRKAMIVFQITVFIILIAVMILVQKQVHYAFTKDLGFAREGLIRVPLGDHNYALFKQEVQKNPEVVSVSGAMWMPPHGNHMKINMPMVSETDKMVGVDGLFVDYGFATTMGIKVVQGSDFDESKIHEGVLVNRMAVKALGMKEAVGERTAFGTVVGVIDDFNMYSLHEAVNPLIIGLNQSMCRDIAIRIKTDDIQHAIASLRKTWAATGGTSPFEFEFTNDILKRMYESDIRFSKTTGLLAIIAIIIASMGLLGLSLLTGRQKIKEIGVRKVLGARIPEVINLLNRDFIICVAIAFLIAMPISWLAMRRWLEGFAYKTGISWWIFVVAGLLAFAITLLTVTYQSYRVAVRNPVEALRYE